MRWLIMPFTRYVDFAGRSCRKEFWLFFLLQIFAVIALALWIYRALVVIGNEGSTGHSVDTIADTIGPALALFGLFVFATFIPSLAVQVRRFHDQDLPGLLVLLNLIPGIGYPIVLVFMCVAGTKGSNRFGPDPLA